MRTTITFSCSRELRDQIAALAQKEHRSINQQVQWMLEKCLESITSQTVSPSQNGGLHPHA
jgi:hypothetical protein